VKREQVGIFFDRDGTISTEIDFLRKPEELELMPKTAQAIREANELGINVFIITNQSGIAGGFLTEGDLSAVHARLRTLLRRQNAHVDAIYYCPHHPDYGNPPYNVPCRCRKPDTGMLKKARKEFNLNLKRSFVVGDRSVDVQKGQNAVCTSFLVLTGYGKTERSECGHSKEVNYVADNAYDAWLQIKKIVKHQNVSSRSTSTGR
jgi:D-glycero-D-manno-heptose 1,7-bisphosphate phosphatase